MKTMYDEWRDAWLEIDTDALRHNFDEVRRAVGEKTKICAVLKAQCYGMDGVQVAKVLCDADCYAVATLSEAVEVRTVTDKEILVLGFVSQPGFETAVKNDITLVAYLPEIVEQLNTTAAEMGKKAKIHIKVNSGMNRIGLMPTEENADVVARWMNLPNIDVTGIFTHLATADEADKSGVRMQMGRFDCFLDMLRVRNLAIPTVHVANSPTVCDMPEYYRDMVRPGVLFTGYYSSDDVSRERIHLKPAVKLKARLGNIMCVKAGEGVGYGFTDVLTRDSVLGLLPIGFSDGLTRGFSHRFYVTIRGHKCPILGNICMDHSVIDITDLPDPQLGEEIVIYGDGINGADKAMNVAEVADMRGTIVDEVLTNIAARVPRIFV